MPARAHGIPTALDNRCFTPPTSKHSPSLPFCCQHCCYTLMYCKSYDMLHDCMYSRTVNLLSMCDSERRSISSVDGRWPKGRAVIWLSGITRKQLDIRFYCQLRVHRSFWSINELLVLDRPLLRLDPAISGAEVEYSQVSNICSDPAHLWGYAGLAKVTWSCWGWGSAGVQNQIVCADRKGPQRHSATQRAIRCRVLLGNQQCVGDAEVGSSS